MAAVVPTGSLGLRSRLLLRRLIAATQNTRFGPLTTPQSHELSRPIETGLQSGHRELDDGAAFFAHFPSQLSVQALCGRRVLDLGCGYGGRTVYYALHGEPEVIEGLEIDAEMVRRCRALADELDAANARFTLGRAEELPFEDQSFDMVLSYDVLEHVDEPARALAEIARVLEPGGEAWLVFPSYLGARSSHLDYLTRIPALHRVFDPDALVTVANEFIREGGGRYGVGLQPAPRRGPFGRKTLPTLNGMTYRESRALAAAAGLTIVSERVTPALHPDSRIGPVRIAGRALAAASRVVRLPELLIGSIALRLRRPHAGVRAAADRDPVAATTQRR